MTRNLLIASVAALAISVPAQAERAKDRDRSAERAQKAENRAAARGGEARQAQARVRPERAASPRMENRVRNENRISQRRERVERVRPQQIERAERVRVERVRPQRIERAERVRTERVRPQRIERAERVRPQRIERAERVRPQRIERTERVRAERVRPQRIDRAERKASRSIERQARVEQRLQRQATAQSLRQQGFDSRAARRIDRQERIRSMRGERLAQRALDTRRVREPSYDVGQRLQTSTLQSWQDDYTPTRFQAFNSLQPQFAYHYDNDDGYLYQVQRDTNLITGLYPILGGAIAVGQPMPFGYSGYEMPYGYRSLYYDTPNSMYGYGDGAIYRYDPTTQLIQAVVALLTGQNFAVGQRMPMGFDVYNVPYAYRDSYYDSNDAWYRYDDGYIYQIDPGSRIVQSMYPVYGGYTVGYPVPAYAGYGAQFGGYPSYSGYPSYAGYPSYGVPYDYQHLYYGAPQYNYHYANGGIYQVDPTTQLVSALVALVTGQPLRIGQQLPAGYSAYNVPYAYRSSYYDTDDSWYRYADGYVYQVDPGSMMIQSAIPLSYGPMAGMALPAGYPAYDVPDMYDDLYYADEDYDYFYDAGRIYAYDPGSRMVHSVAGLVTDHSFAVGQPLPMGYDVYNVPYAYRDRYYDSSDSMYRYANGQIYQVDPATRLITAIIDALV